MKKKTLMLKGIIFIMSCTFILSACSRQIDNIRPGLYKPDEGFSSILLEEYNTFILATEDVTYSYTPNGNYTYMFMMR